MGETVGTVGSVSIKRGSKIVGSLKSGETFQITEIRENWLGFDSAKINGWVYRGNVQTIAQVSYKLGKEQAPTRRLVKSK